MDALLEKCLDRNSGMNDVKDTYGDTEREMRDKVVEKGISLGKS